MQKDVDTTDHTGNEAVIMAADWYVKLPPKHRPKPIVPALKERFGLNAVECCQVIREAQLRWARAR